MDKRMNSMIRVNAILFLVFSMFYFIDISPVRAEKDIVIEQRINLMRTDVLVNFRVIKAFVKEGKGSIEEVGAAAKVLAAAADKFLPLFVKGTGRPDVNETKTRSIQEIWDEWPTFEKANDAMRRNANNIVRQASEGLTDELEQTFVLLGKEACRTCHKQFRGPKAN